MSKSHPLRLNNGDEQDALTGWHKVLKVFDNNTGLRKYWKKHYNKRVRQDAKRQIRKEQDDG